MKKQQIILIAAVVIIFAGLIYLGVKQAPKEKSVVNNQPFENVSPTVNNNEAGESSTAANPSQPAPLEQSAAPKEAVKITFTEDGIAPVSFAVKVGSEVALSVFGADQQVHIFKFKDKALGEVIVAVGPKDTRVMSFLAPKEPGEYEYYCDTPGHIEAGEKGKMIIK